MCGKLVDPEDLHRIFSSTRFGRVLDRTGYARFRHWRRSGEPALAGASVAVWLYGAHLTIAVADEALAHDGVTYQPDRRQLATVTEARLFETPYRSPQLRWEWSAAEWLTVSRVAPYASRRRPRMALCRRRMVTTAKPARGDEVCCHS